MSELKATPGPWEVTGGNDVWLGDDGCIHAFSEENAHLISAAPDLYEALEVAVQCLRGVDVSDRNIDVIESALAKARGEEAPNA